MMTPELLGYIRRRIAAGDSPQKISQKLLAAGWPSQVVQKALKEGGISRSSGGNAGFWLRFFASLIDSALLSGVLVVGSALLLLGIAKGGARPISEAGEAAGLIPTVFFLLYFTILEGSSIQGSLGKRLLKIKVTAEDGAPLGFFRAFLRTICKILSAIPLMAGYIMAAFTQNKQALHDKVAGALVIREGETRLLRAALISLLAVIILSGGVGSYLYFVQIPKLTQQAVLVMATSPSTTPPAQLKEVVEQDRPQPRTLSEDDYQAVISSESASFEEGIWTSAGPAALKLSTFWDHDKKNPNVWVEVRVPPLPNLDLGGKLVRVIIHHVRGSDGKELYHDASPLEKEFFQNLSLSMRRHPQPYLSAIRSVHLKPGTREEDIRSIEGELILRLPVGVEILSLAVNGKKQEAQGKLTGVQVRLMEAQGSQVKLRYEGKATNYLQTLAYNEEGQVLQRSSSSWFSSGEDVWNYQFVFRGVPKRIEVLVASKMLEKRYPFVLHR